jgi:hypothetical protein
VSRTQTDPLGKPGIPQNLPYDSTLPRIDRIILYIDDLDRCPEKITIKEPSKHNSFKRGAVDQAAIIVTTA